MPRKTKRRRKLDDDSYEEDDENGQVRVAGTPYGVLDEYERAILAGSSLPGGLIISLAKLPSLRGEVELEQLGDRGYRTNLAYRE